MLNLASINQHSWDIDFFTTRQGDCYKILKFDLHIGYQKELFDFWDQLGINLFEWLLD